MFFKYKGIIVVLLMILSLNIFADEVENLYSLAVSEYDKGMFEEATEKLKVITKKYKENNWADASYYLLGDIALKRNDPKQAREYFQKIITDYSQSPLVADSYYLIGKSYEIEKNFDKMANIYRDFILKFPENYWIHEANQSLKRYTRSQGKKVYNVLYDIALEFQRKGMDTIASDYYLNIVRNYKESPYYNASLYMLADMKYNAGYYDEALTFLEEIEKNNEYFSRASFKTGDIYFFRKDYKKAEKAYQRAYDNVIEDDPDLKAESLYMIAESQLINGDQKKAKVALEKIVEDYPDSDWRYKAESTLSNIDSAYISKTDIIPGVKSDKPKIDIEKQKLKTISKLKEKVEAFNKNTQISPYKDSLSFSKNLEEAAEYDREKNYFDALKHYEKAHEYKKENPDVLYRMGILYNQMKAPEKALENIREYLKNSDGDDIILNYYAYLLYKLNRFDESIEAYKKAYEKQNTEREREEIRLAIERVRMGKK
ncbi:MAG: hypothetical protein C0601_12165 [Candidatus Muiribacterium halophilum]|uniref:Outer membrane lipoprotein BamD-like domain-containing protein n=1 Tax=Muiribacterium halophilum TaxID=2053465 RepID=A0A2N5ZAN4_MUIH1|nr:MAG: hypothetical protein C0601_12165 [Candidatus Muirbacterium halophilum]